MAVTQRTLFHELPDLPEGFQYKDAVLSPNQERVLIKEFSRLPFKEFEFRGFLGKRRTVSFGWRYDFNVRELQAAKGIPSFLLDLRQAAAEFAGLSDEQLQHALVTEYSPGAAIGWHKDRPEFREVIGMSLLAPSLAHGGKDRHPFPVPLRVYDETIRVLKSGVQKAKLGRTEEVDALKRLDQQARQVERYADGPSFEALVDEEFRQSSSYGGRSVLGWEKPSTDEMSPMLAGSDTHALKRLGE